MSSFKLGFNNTGQKTVMLVKCTDSALKAIDDSLKFCKGSSVLPAVKFSGSHGEFRFPALKGERRFDFTIISLPVDLQGSYEAISENANKKSFTSLANFNHRMVIKANDDVYQETLVKMSKAEEDLKKYSTKQLKEHSGTKIGRKLKVNTVQSPHSDGFKSSRNLPISHSETAFGPMRISTRPMAPSRPNKITNSLVNSTNSGSDKKSYSNARSYQDLRLHDTYRISPIHDAVNENSLQTKSSSQLKDSNKLQAHKPTVPNTKLLRQYVIHYLALAPFRHLELSKRIKNTGLSCDELSATVLNILSEVATLRGDKYYIHKSFLREISLDWPLYSDNDKKLVQSKITDSNKAESTLTSVHTQKRLSETSSFEESQPLQKKCRKQSDDTFSSPNLTSPSKSDSPNFAEATACSKEISKESLKKDYHAFQVHVTTLKEMQSPISDPSDYELKYPPLKDELEYKRYFTEFFREYPEYKQLHREVTKVKNEWETMQKDYRARLAASDFDVDSMMRYMQVIFESYNKDFKENKIFEKNQRFMELHNKLYHLKQCLQNYDASLLCEES